MPTLEFTPQQREAIVTTGRSVIVSAAAGSGKTAVLAERCAYLVCDAPPDERCDISQLLVVTFTEAAAAEMRGRIVQAIRDRAAGRRDDERLREQVDLVDAAQISTVHSFCLWLIRRWFNHVGVDPSATVLDEDETRLLKRDVLEALFRELYPPAAPDDPLGVERLGGGEETGRRDSGANGGLDELVGDRDAMRRAFLALVDDYGLGDDRDIARFVLRVAAFAESLPDPQRWLREAVEAVSSGAERTVARCLPELATELAWQIEHAQHAAESIEAGDPAGYYYAQRLRDYAARLTAWAGALAEGPAVLSGEGTGELPERSVPETLARLEAVRRAIAAFEFPGGRAPALGKDVDPAIRAARDAASKRLSAFRAKSGLFHKRIRARFALFSVEESVADLRRVAPYVAAIAALAMRFRRAFAARKRELNGLDFADLERFAFELLCHEGDTARPSDVARSLQARFAHVLVDEFQDINPIQQAIIRLSSRECDAHRPNNLFVVGDVKQSIYRFRLAEPGIFTERLTRFRAVCPDGAAVTLQANFRSRPEILEAVNAVFRRLMPTGAGGVVYDADAELRAGRRVADSSAGRVEFHVLERSWSSAVEPEDSGTSVDSDHEDGDAGEATADDDAQEYGWSGDSDPARWAPIEREAYLIGSLIREWRAAGQTVTEGRPMTYRDIAVLLRAKRFNAERMTAMLGALGIPAFADAGGSLMAAREVRDVVAALRLLDNAQQDIPMAAVLRSGILGEPWSAEDLLEVRCLDRDTAFHDAVRRYAVLGPNLPLRERSAVLLSRLEAYRRDLRNRPLADVLWMMLDRHGFLAYAGGLPNGAQRRANVLALHELSRKFGSFRRQGLHRFLSFLDSLADDDRELAVAPATGEADDVVRVMSIHQAKGLEFPVVFVANLGAKLNLGDRAGRMIFERRSGIGLRVVDPDRMIEYRSVAHARVAAEIERTTREEELRVLYVAMTRARDRLVLVGSAEKVSRRASSTGGNGGRPTRLSLATAASPLDWLMPAMADAGEPVRTEPVDFRTHLPSEMSAWRVGDVADSTQAETRSAVAALAPLPAREPLAPMHPEVERVTTRLETTYPWLPAASVPSAVAASEFKGSLDYLSDLDTAGPAPIGDFSVPASKYGPVVAEAAARRGIITHRVLQHLDWGVARDEAGVASELQRLLDAGLVTERDTASVDVSSIVWFAGTPLAEEIRSAGDRYRREFLFIATEPMAALDPSAVGRPDDRVLVRGIVDGILPSMERLEIVDFKTDSIQAEAADERGERYRSQMTLYARAVSRLWHRPVGAARLVFLSPRTIVTLSM